MKYIWTQRRCILHLNIQSDKFSRNHLQRIHLSNSIFIFYQLVEYLNIKALFFTLISVIIANSQTTVRKAVQPRAHVNENEYIFYNYYQIYLISQRHLQDEMYSIILFFT